MDFALSPDQILFRDSVDRFFTDAYANGTAGWQAFVELGLTAAPFPEDLGGAGSSAVDLMFVANGVGRSLAPEPFVSGVVLVGALLNACASDTRVRRLIDAIASGQSRAAYAEIGAGGFTTGNLNGQSRLVSGGAYADLLIVGAPASGHVAIVAKNAKGVTLSPFTTIDGRSAADITFRNVAISSDDLLASGPQGAAVLATASRAARAAWCGEASGAMRAALDLTLDYVRTRKQFGRPIGSFQALQHRLVDMRIACDLTDTMARVAAMAVDEARPAEAERLVAAASAQAVAGARLIAEESIQMHGGMGMTDECHAGKYAKRLLALTALLGSEEKAVETFLSAH